MVKATATLFRYMTFCSMLLLFVHSFRTFLRPRVLLALLRALVLFNITFLLFTSAFYS